MDCKAEICEHCHGRHHSYMCRWKTTVTQVQHIGEGDEEVDWDTYYDQDDQGTGNINAIQEEDDIVEILDEDLAGNIMTHINRSHDNAPGKHMGLDKR